MPVTLRPEVKAKLKIFGEILAFFFVFSFFMGILSTLFYSVGYFIIIEQETMFDYNTAHGKIIDNVLTFFSLLCATKISMHFFDHKKMIDIGLRFSVKNVRELLLGLTIPFAMLSIVFLFYIVFGFGHTVTGNISFVNDVLFAFFVFVLVAFNEETLFRGYIFQKFIELTNKYVAMFVLSFCFGLAHLFNPHITILSVINIVLAGLLFSICYIKTNSLWLPISMHFSWNFVQGNIFGFPVSGLNEFNTLINFVPTGPQWITGGYFGPEGGIVVSILLLIVSFLIFYNQKLFKT